MIVKRKQIWLLFPFVSLLLTLALAITGCGSTPTLKPQPTFALKVRPETTTEVQVGQSVAIVAEVEPLEKLDLKWSVSGTAEGTLNTDTGEQVVYTAGKGGVDIVIAEGTTASGVPVKQTVSLTVATPVPPTDTPMPPTDTPVPPTDTPVPQTDTPVPPTDTPVPPTATPVPPTATPTCPQWTFESGTAEGWVAARGPAWTDNYALGATVTSEVASEGQYSLRCDFDGTSVPTDQFYKAIFYIERQLDMAPCSTLVFAVHNSIDGMEVAISLSTGPNWVWHESPRRPLGTGWNEDVTFDLDATNFKTEASNWRDPVPVADKNDTKLLTIIFIPPKRPLAGSLYLDAIRTGGQD